MKKASESFIDALYYHEMFGSASCWMNIPSVDCELRKLKSKSAKITALKENIRIRVLGLGWEDLATPWSINGKDLTSDELAKHLKSIIKEQRKRSIPSKPPIPLPERKNLPILGTKTLDLAVIESTHLLKGEILREMLMIYATRERLTEWVIVMLGYNQCQDQILIKVC